MVTILSIEIKGVGDDAAVIDNRQSLTVVSTDLLVEGIHFDLMYTPLKHLGYKAVVVNLSDIYAMNALPRQITVSPGCAKRLISGASACIPSIGPVRLMSRILVHSS